MTLYTLTSPLHDQEELDRNSRSFLEEIEKASGFTFDVRGEDFKDYRDSFMPVIYVRTGGTEGLFRKVLGQVHGYVRLLTSGKSNSLAASMEILSFLRKNGMEGEIIHGNPAYIAERLQQNLTIEKALSSLRGMRLGVIGEPSDWLIASQADYAAVKARTGMELVDLEIDELVHDSGMLHPDEEPLKSVMASKTVAHFDANAPARLKQYREGSFRICAALRKMLSDHQLNGFTLRCFDLLGKVGNTGCMSLATFNAQGIPACCEGDIPALLTMAIGNALTGNCGFQANPSRIDPDKGEITLAHCTVPLNMVRKYTYDTHFESGIGIAVKGELEEGPVTIAKISGDLRRWYFQDASLLRNQSDPDLCRTQIVIRADGLADYFLSDPIGNHHIIFPGHCSRLFEAFMKRLG